MYEPDLAETQSQQLLERTLLTIACRLRRHACRLVDRDPILALADDRQLRRVLDDRDPIVRINLARCDRHRPLIHEHPPRRNELARLTPRDAGIPSRNGLIEPHSAY